MKEHLKKRLTPLQFAVVCEAATEPPFKNAYWNHHEAGLYVDVVSGQPLFASIHKFDSGTGWPSFTRPVETSSVIEVPDESHGMLRVEVRSQVGSHLGHVFPDGPVSEGGQRYCINSASLRFVPLADLVKENFSQYASLFGLETIDFAGGCFWGLQELLRSYTGVVATAVGYAGAELPNPTYEHHGGHAETVRVLFDPKKVSLDALLVFFFSIHDPTTENRQGNDVGTSYRSAIFVQSDAQAAVAKQVIAQIDGAKAWQGRKIVTQVQKAGPFWLAEDYHQDYLQKNPGGYSCHYKRDIS